MEAVKRRAFPWDPSSISPINFEARSVEEQPNANIARARISAILPLPHSKTLAIVCGADPEEPGSSFTRVFWMLHQAAACVALLPHSSAHTLRLRLPCEARTALQILASTHTECEMGALVIAARTTS